MLEASLQCELSTDDLSDCVNRECELLRIDVLIFCESIPRDNLGRRRDGRGALM